MSDDSISRRDYAKGIGMLQGFIYGGLSGLVAGLLAQSTNGHKSQIIGEGGSKKYDLPITYDEDGFGNFDVEIENIRDRQGDPRADITLKEADAILENGDWEAEVGNGYVGPGNYEVEVPGGEVLNVEVEDVRLNEVEVALEYKSEERRF